MPIIIDGWNFIRNRSSPISDDNGDALDSALHLIAYLNRFQKTHGDPIIVAFDSRREHLDFDYENTPMVKIVAAKNADQYIKKYIEKVPEKQRRNLRVVSSDNEVFFFAKSFYATPIRCEEFWSKMKRG